MAPSERDGVFGRKTLVAVCWFQADMNMHVDGIPGDETLTKLYVLIRIPLPPTSLGYADTSEFQRLSFGSKGLLVQYLQQQAGTAWLSTAAYVDGFYGVQTKQAVIAYQEAQRLFVDGVVNKRYLGQPLRHAGSAFALKSLTLAAKLGNVLWGIGFSSCES